ncbi:MAG: N-acetylneuraminate synthase family protein [Parcubacteria group bacterium]|nr:N-acetylneuraminate synthase family protein [Parcubacteria group bacterium]
MHNVPDKVIIVAEFTTNHVGDLNRLRRMVRFAKESGADLIKIQKRNVDSFYSKDQLDVPYTSPFGTTLGDYRRALELSVDDIREFDAECKKMEIDWFATVLDFESFVSLQPFNRHLHKIPSTISDHKDYHAKIAEHYKGPLVVSTGYTSSDYEDYVQKTFRENETVYLLQATSAYPTPAQDCAIAVVRHYHALSKKNPKIIPGYSSHDEGALGCMMAVAAGARMIEKHVKLGSTPWVHYNSVALDLDTGEFARFVRDIRRAEMMCGSEIKEIKASEHHKYPVNK